MPSIPDSPWSLHPARLRWQDGNLPEADDYGDVYFSAENGLAETRHVFLQGNRLAERWQALPPGSHFTIGETGFGSGLNFLACWQLWQQYAPDHAWLHYLSVEKHPFRRDDLQRALSRWPELGSLTAELLAAWPPLARGHHSRVFPQARIRLQLIFDDAETAFDTCLGDQSPQHRVNAWFLDGFAPSRNPELWTPALFKRMQALSAEDATLASFTAAGQVRRDLQAAGFHIERQPGFGRKRHMSAGHRLPVTHSSTAATAPETALVIGAGLAGLFTARSLLQRGWQVTVLEAGNSPAAGASGNRQGLLFHRLSRDTSPVSRFSQQAFTYSAHLYRQALHEGRLPSEALQAEGLLQLPKDSAQAEHWQQLAALFADSPDFAQWLDTDEASPIAGLPLPGPALYLPGSATLSPVAICHTLAAQTGLDLRLNSPVARIAQTTEGQWQVLDEQQHCIAEAAVLVIAAGPASTQLLPELAPPLKALRGQVSLLPTARGSEALRCAVCHDGYVSPAWQGLHSVGASFDLNDSNPALSEHSHRDNLQRLQHHWPAMHERLHTPDTDPSQLDGRVGFRCTSPDYLPLIGAVPDAGLLRSNGVVQTLPGLFLNTAHGSRGLSYAPFAAELLAACIEDRAWPADAALHQALSPARFLLRQLRKKRA